MLPHERALPRTSGLLESRAHVPLAVGQVAIAARLVVGDPGTRRLFAFRPRAMALGMGAAAATITMAYALFTPLALGPRSPRVGD